MSWTTYPVTPDRFEDFADIVNPSRRARACWCVSPRLRAADVRELGGGDRETAMRALCAQHPPGVVTYRDGEPVGWCNLGPRAAIPRLAASTLIHPVDDVPVWSIVCLVVRSRHRRQGVTAQLIDGAIAWARSEGAPAVEAYPVEPPDGHRMDNARLFVGTRSMFDRAGFDVVGITDAQANGLPRLIMRKTLDEVAS
ncbi:GNAT family N-acetyltransferase [Tersicoccus sp. MR15.9]|uniref:GNAT family N-acetyltransferase n=1 Tax=Tersicoccus mangrovi TaxID=3121635 RepID=UPI002FE54D68